MEKQGWAPLVLSGAVPREAGDFLAILIIALTSLELLRVPAIVPMIGSSNWLLLLTVVPTCALASLSNTTRRLREDLALFAYGGSSWLIGPKYFLRGLTCTLVAISPAIAFPTQPLFRSLNGELLSLVAVIVSGGLFYSLPSLRRTRSLDFVEHYKG